MNKPMIGIIPLYDKAKESYWMLPGYMKAVEAAGGIPVMLPLTADEDIIRTLAETYDGFLFTGGHDVNPALYGERARGPWQLCMERDAMEEMLFRQVIGLDKPAFGICRGLQLFNVLLGGTLYQDLPTELSADSPVLHKQQPPYDRPAHRVRLERDSPLYALFQTESVMVNSYHHQGVKTLAEPLAAMAKAEDGLVEAVYMPDKTFIMAVQWHPEFSYRSDRLQFLLFEKFVAASSPR